MKESNNKTGAILTSLDEILAARKKDINAKDSYVASLHRCGLEKILRKVSEEATETLLAAIDAERDPAALSHLAEEIADLWFHSLVAFSHLNGGGSAQILKILEERMHIKQSTTQNKE